MVSSAALSGAMFNIAPPHLREAATRREREAPGSSVFTHALSLLSSSSFSYFLLVQKQLRKKGRVGLTEEEDEEQEKE